MCQPHQTECKNLVCGQIFSPSGAITAATTITTNHIHTNIHTYNYINISLFISTFASFLKPHIYTCLFPTLSISNQNPNLTLFFSIWQTCIIYLLLCLSHYPIYIFNHVRVIIFINIWMILNGDVIFMLFHSFRSSPLTHPLLFSVPLRTHPPPPRASILSRRKQFKARSFFIFNNSFIFQSLSPSEKHIHTRMPIQPIVLIEIFWLNAFDVIWWAFQSFSFSCFPLLQPQFIHMSG